MDKLKAMRTFVRIADEGSLTAAARVDEVSLPSVVRTLAGLEAALRVRLFNRTTRRLALTDEGRRYLESCRALLAGIDDAERAVQSGAASAGGPISVTAPVQFGQLHVCPVITRFVQRHRDVTVSVALLDRVVDLVEEGFDVGVRIGQLQDSSLVARPLGHVRRVLVASPGFLRRHGRPRHPRELQQARCIRLTGAVSGWTFYEGERVLSVPVSGPLVFNHVAPALDACAAGAGFGVFMSYQAAAMLADKRLVRLLPDYEPAPRPIHVLYPQARLLPARTRAFVDALLRDLTGFEA